MKRSGLILLLIIYSLFTVIAQDTTIIYYNKDWKQTKPSKALYFEKRIKIKENSYVITKSKINNTPFFICYYKSLQPLIENGRFIYYDNNSEIKISGLYNDGYMDGIWMYYNNFKNRFDTLDYTGIKDIYEGKIPKTDIPEIFLRSEVMPVKIDSNTGQETNIRQYLTESIHYPYRARENNIQENIYIQFFIASDGKVYNIKCVKGVNKDLIFEAIRIVRDSSPWIPGKQKEKPINITTTSPIIFSLEK